MENKEAIIRKLSALKAKFEHANTKENEASAAMAMYARLMEQYDLTESEITLKTAGIAQHRRNTGSKNWMRPIAVITKGIEILTETYVTYSKDQRKNIITVFNGTRADCDYAEFLSRLIFGAMAREFKAFKLGNYMYKELNQTMHGREIKNTFEVAFASRMQQRLMELAAERHEKGQALIVLKNALIAQALGDQYKDKKQTNRLVKYTGGKSVIAAHAYKAADDVKLRQEAEHKETLLLN